MEITVVMTAVEALMMGLFLKKPIVTIIGQNRSLIILNPSNVTSTAPNGFGTSLRFFMVWGGMVN
jgi:hypothetical protein